MGTLGESGLFGGGDLTALLQKRPADFLVRWLENPAAINRSHRMPVFTFTADELKSLSLWAKEQAAKSAGYDVQAEQAAGADPPGREARRLVPLRELPCCVARQE